MCLRPRVSASLGATMKGPASTRPSPHSFVIFAMFPQSLIVFFFFFCGFFFISLGTAVIPAYPEDLNEFGALGGSGRLL